MEEITNNTNTEPEQAPAQESRTFSQDEVNAIVKDRLERAEKKWKDQATDAPNEETAKRAEDLERQTTELGKSLKEATDKAESDAKRIAELEDKVKAYETASVKSRIALEAGLPIELADRITGADEEEMRKDAALIASFFSAPKGMPQPKAEATAEIDGVTAAFRKLNPNLKI